MEKIRAKKALGQNFLVDDSVLTRIVACVDPTPEDAVLEIGPGRGALTERLIGLPRTLDAIEIEPDPVRTGAHIGLGHEGVILDGAGPPGAAVDEHIDRRIRLRRRKDIELLHRGRAVG